VDKGLRRGNTYWIIEFDNVSILGLVDKGLRRFKVVVAEKRRIEFQSLV